mmetsp:Transcript_71897/g.120583  ORF Transcript_71897/g.120583 Transcript_71897/m.120583 type:complete len:278 (-) Transcript_71897:232-1065(-)
MVVSAIGHQLVTLLHQSRTQGTGIGLDLLGILLECWACDLLQLSGNTSNLVLVGTTLKSREHSKVDLLGESGWGSIRTLGLAAEDHAGARTTQTLVGGGGDHITVLEGIVLLASRHQTTDMGNVSQQQSTTVVSCLTEAVELDLTWVRTGASDQHLRTEGQRELVKLVVVDVPILIHVVRQRLKVDGGCRDLLPGSSVIPVRQMSTVRQVKTHDTVVRVQKTSENRKVGRTSGVWLNIDSPLLRVQAVCGQRTLLAQVLDLIDELVSTIVTSTTLTL